MTEKSCCSCDNDKECCQVATVTDDENDVDDPALIEMMKKMELEAENIPDDPETLKEDLQNRSLRMLTPAQVDEMKKENERKQMTPQQKRAALRRAIRAKQADRAKMTPDQRPTDHKGKTLRGRPRMTQDQIHKAKTGQLGKGQRNVNVDNLSADDVAQASEMVEKNPHLASL